MKVSLVLAALIAAPAFAEGLTVAEREAIRHSEILELLSEQASIRYSLDWCHANPDWNRAECLALIDARLPFLACSLAKDAVARLGCYDAAAKAVPFK